MGITEKLIGSEESDSLVELQPSGEVCEDFSEKKEKEREKRKKPDVEVI